MIIRRSLLSAALLSLALAPAAALSGCDGGTETAEDPEPQVDQNDMAEEPEPQVDQNGATEQQAEENGTVEPQDQMNGDGAAEEDLDGGTEQQAEEPPADPENGMDGDLQD